MRWLSKIWWGGGGGGSLRRREVGKDWASHRHIMHLWLNSDHNHQHLQKKLWIQLSECQTLRKFVHLELFSWDLLCNLTLGHFEGRTTLYMQDFHAWIAICDIFISIGPWFKTWRWHANPWLQIWWTYIWKMFSYGNVPYGSRPDPFILDVLQKYRTKNVATSWAFQFLNLISLFARHNMPYTNR